MVVSLQTWSAHAMKPKTPCSIWSVLADSAVARQVRSLAEACAHTAAWGPPATRPTREVASWSHAATSPASLEAAASSSRSAVSQEALTSARSVSNAETI